MLLYLSVGLVVGFALGGGFWLTRQLGSDPGLKASLRVLVLGVALMGTCIAYFFFGPGYYGEFNYIKAALAAIPGVRVIEAAGHRELNFENIFARVHVEGKGDIRLMDLTWDSLRTAQHLRVSELGPFSFGRIHWALKPEHDDLGGPLVWRKSGASSLDFGPKGDFSATGILAGWFEPRLRNVQDLVAHYDELVAMVGSLQKEELFFTNADGSTVEIVIRPARRHASQGSVAAAAKGGMVEKVQIAR